MAELFFQKNKDDDKHQESDREKALKVLIDLKTHKETPSLIPKITREEQKEGIVYKFNDYSSNFENFLKNHQECLGFFTFIGVFSFFHQLINGLAFLEINDLTINIKSSSFFISQSNELKCIDCERLTKEKSKDSIRNFGILILHIMTFMKFEKISFLVKNELKRIQIIIHELDRKYTRSIAKTEIIKLQVVIKIMKKIFEKSNEEELSFLELFSEMLKETPLEHLEQIILLTETNCNFLFYKI